MTASASLAFKLVIICPFIYSLQSLSTINYKNWNKNLRSSLKMIQLNYLSICIKIKHHSTFSFHHATFLLFYDPLLPRSAGDEELVDDKEEGITLAYSPNSKCK